MKPHELIRSIEDDAENLQRLCADILAAVEVGAQQGRITFPSESDGEKFAQKVVAWRQRLARLQASVTDYPNVAFRYFPREQSRG